MKKFSETIKDDLRSCDGVPASTKLRSGVNGIKKQITSLSKFIDLIGGFFYFALILIVVVNVIMRTLFSKPFIGTVEIAEIFTAVAVGLTISYCAVQKEHITIDFILAKFPKKFQQVITFAVYVPALGFLITAAWMMFKYGESARINGNVSPTMGIGYSPFIYIIVLGFLVYVLVVLFKAISLFLFNQFFGMIINNGTWNSLPPTVQQALSVMPEELPGVWDKLNKDSYKMNAEHKKVEIIHLSSEENDAWLATIEPVAVKHAADLDKKGQPGNQIVAQVKELATKYIAKNPDVAPYLNY